MVRIHPHPAIVYFMCEGRRQLSLRRHRGAPPRDTAYIEKPTSSATTSTSQGVTFARKSLRQKGHDCGTHRSKHTRWTRLRHVSHRRVLSSKRNLSMQIAQHSSSSGIRVACWPRSENRRQRHGVRCQIAPAEGESALPTSMTYVQHKRARIPRLSHAWRRRQCMRGRQKPPR